MKRRFKRGLALLLTLCLLRGNLAFAQGLPETSEEPVIKEEMSAEEEEAPGENAENADVEAEEQEENAPGEDESAIELSDENVPEPVRGDETAIYLNGQSGDDGNNGLASDQAVKTFGQAKKLATDNKQIEKIIVIGTTEIEGDITLENTNAIVQRGENFNDVVFRVSSGKTATLKHITIDGNSESNKTITKSLIHAESGSILNIEDDAVIRNNKMMIMPANTGMGGAIYTNQATVNMVGGCIEDNSANYGSGIYLSDSTMSISGGNIRNNKAIIKEKINTNTNDATPRGGGICAYQSTLNMTGGVVEGNEAIYGGGIELSYSTMDFSSGTVQNNRAKRCGFDILYNGKVYTQYYSGGGGICAYQGSTLHISNDAKVQNNSAHEIGGGICMGTQQPAKGNLLYMTGGTIDGNTAGASGGGIFIQAAFNGGRKSVAHISAGQITNNQMNGEGDTQMVFGGGGVYVNGSRSGQNGELYLNNALIRDNKAQGTKEEDVEDPNTGETVHFRYKGWGGGYAACPISKTKIHVTNGVAIYYNIRKDLGNDLYILSIPPEKWGDHGGNPTYTLSKRMLGGALWNWIDDETGEPLAAEMYERENSLEYYKYTALRTDFQGSQWVEKLAKVWITGNTSVTAGGGIGSNGSVFFGTEGETTKIEVEKKWEDKDNAKRPDRIQVKLLAQLEGDDQKYVVETCTVTAKDEWKITFDNLPKFYHAQFDVQDGEFQPAGAGQEIIYSVVEVPVSGYESGVTGDAEHGFIITNKRKPETPPPTPSERFIEIPVEKIWQDDGHEDKRPTEITVTLYADGVATDKTLVLSTANEWKGAFRNLPEKKDGKSITYTVKEIAVKGYENVLTGNQSDGFVLTNTYKPEKPPTPPKPPKSPIPAIPFVRIPRAGA